MKYETQFPRGFPEVGDVIRFTCHSLTPASSGFVTAEQITRRKMWSTVEVLVVGRDFDEATELHYIHTSDDLHKHIHKEEGDWLSEGWRLTESEHPQGTAQPLLHFEKYRTEIHELKVVRKHR